MGNALLIHPSQAPAKATPMAAVGGAGTDIPPIRLLAQGISQ